MRDVVFVFVLVYFYITAVLVVTSIFSRALLRTDNAVTYTRHGLWERCSRMYDSESWDCHGFDWQNEVQDTVAADRVRSVLAFGTMTFIGAVVILISPFLFLLLLCCDASTKVMSNLYLASCFFMGVMGSITWILLDTYLHDIIIDDLTWIYGYNDWKYDWGAYVFMTAIGMTSMLIPVSLYCCFSSDNDVHPASRHYTRA